MRPAPFDYLEPGTIDETCEFMYKYNTVNTISNPDGSPNGWIPDPDRFVIYTYK